MDDDILPPGWKFRRNVLLTPEPLPPDLETWSSVLEFKAQRCFLTIGTVLSDEDEPNHVIASLVKDGPHSDAVIGAIVLNIAGPDAIPTGARCELIAISSGDAGWVASFLAIGNALPQFELLHKDYPKWCCLDNPECRGPKVYSFYNVLWIEWSEQSGCARGKSKIALRKALGRVHRSFWDSQDAEFINVRLG